MKTQALLIRIASLVALVASAAAGAYLWRESQPMPPGSVLALVWFFGGAVAFIGGVLQVKQSRALALVCPFGGFVVFFSATLYLNRAARAYDENHGYWRGKTIIH